MRFVLASLVSFCCITATLPASAAERSPLESVFVSPGFVWSWASTPDTAQGPGFEVSAGYSGAIRSQSPFFPTLGALYRAQDLDTGAGRYARRTAAAEGAFGPLGLELGYAWRQAATHVPEANGVHVSPFFSIGFFYVGPSWLFPLSGSSTEFALNMGLKIPLPHTAFFSAFAAKVGHD